jgi:hypothetical protein
MFRTRAFCCVEGRVSLTHFRFCVFRIRSLVGFCPKYKAII